MFEVILTSSFLFIVGLYYYLTSNHDFWVKRNVKGPKPIPIFGNFKDVALGRIFQALHLHKFYNEFKDERFIGIFLFSDPILVLKDPDLIKDVLIKDFHNFPDRAPVVPIDSDPFSLNLATLEYERWRPLRIKLSPVFTSGRIREMLHILNDCADYLELFMEKLIAEEDIVDVRELAAKYTTDAIGMCAFGLNMNAIEDEDSEFRKFGRAVTSASSFDNFRRFLKQVFPKFGYLFGSFVLEHKTKDFINAMKQNIEYRRESHTKRNDFLDLLINLQDRKEKLTKFDNLLLGQIFVFFLAGFETSSATISNALYEMAQNEDVQRTLRTEIMNHVGNENDKITYETIRSMKYLDYVMKETLRKYPPASVLLRRASAPYTLSGTNVTIPKGGKVFVPTWSIHRDPDIYPDPEKFDPERFNEESTSKRHPMTYLPFGDGPHNCIGARFANVQVKIGIISIIRNYKLSVCDQTNIPYVVEPKSFLLSPKGGIRLKVTKI